MENSQSEVEFSRRIPLSELVKPETEIEIEATAKERAALAKRLGLLELEHLRAVLTLRRKGNSPLVLVTGRFAADVVQACVVTLEPVPARVEETLRCSFSFTGAARRSPDDEVADLVVVEPEGEDPPEPVGPEGIDLGEAVVQQLAVALDPYPRAPGATLERQNWGADEDDEGAAEGPFGVLKAFKSGVKDH